MMVSVLAHVSRLSFSLDPLIAEAKRRMRRRRLVVGALIVALAAGTAGAVFAARGAGPTHAGRSGALGGRQAEPPAGPSRVVVDVFGQSSRAAEVGGRQLAETLSVFRSGRLAAPLPAPRGSMRPLASVAAQMRGEPGRLLLGATRRVDTAGGALYLVPTTRGWACMQGQRFETCQRGLLPQGVNWHFQSAADGVDVVGIAADRVSSVVWRYGKTERRASLRHNVFFVHQPVSSTPGRRAFPPGTLTISYRDGGPSASVPLR